MVTAQKPSWRPDKKVKFPLRSRLRMGQRTDSWGRVPPEGGWESGDGGGTPLIVGQQASQDVGGHQQTSIAGEASLWDVQVAGEDSRLLLETGPEA